MNTNDKKCVNCGTTVKVKGHVYWPLIPSTAIIFGMFVSKGLCDECASKMNVIGFLSTLAVVVAVVITVFIYLGKQ